MGGVGVAAGESTSVVVESDTHGAVDGEEDGEGGDGSLVLADFEDIPAGSEASKSFPLEVPAALQEKKKEKIKSPQEKIVFKSKKFIYVL